MQVEPSILFVCASSGAFVSHHLMLAAAAAERCRVNAALTIDDPGHIAIIQAKNIAVHAISLSRKSRNPFRVLREVQALRRILRAVEPEVVNAINIKSVLVAALANAGSPSQFVGTVTGLGHLFSGDGLPRRLLRQTTLAGLRHALGRQRHTLIHSNTDDLEEFAHAGVTGREHMCIVPVPGIDTSEYRYMPEPSGPFRIVLPSRMLWEKGVGEFVQAAATVHATIPDVEFILAGEPDPGNPSSIDAEQLRAWSMDGLVTWLGKCDDIPSVMASCHAVCLPSYYREGFPRVLPEAMACGRPIITTDVPGCRDAVTREDAGLLVPPRDASSLAKAITRLAVDKALRGAMGKTGREKAEREYSEKYITGRMLDHLIPRRGE